MQDTVRWRASPGREEIFGPLGVTNIRTFVDPQNPTRVAVLMAGAMTYVGVLAETPATPIEAETSSPGPDSAPDGDARDPPSAR